MKTKTNDMKGSRVAWFPHTLNAGKFFFSVLTLIGIQASLHAQVAPLPQFTKPTVWFGVAGGANFNNYTGTTQVLNDDLTVPAAFGHGSGSGIFMAALAEYRKPDSRWGGSLQLGYDSRKGSFTHVMTPCNCEANLSTTLSYFTVEPVLRFNPFKSNFYLFGGPRVAFNMSKSFTYSLFQSGGPPENTNVTEFVEADFSNMNSTLISMQIGAGYDMPLTGPDKQTQVVFSPFVSFQPYFGQAPRSIETWNVTTVRVGAALKFGRGKLIPVKAAVANPEVQFSIHSPTNIPTERRIRETFPLRNYVFFDLGSTEIPGRYVLLTKDQVKDFKEDQLEVFAPKKLAGRSGREMVVYYNVLNILGDRMGKNPSSTITLVGSSEKGPADGNVMAQSVKTYLTSVFGISPTRISLEGRKKPKIPSEKPGGTVDVTLLREGDRRVSIESTAPDLLMEFQSGHNAPLRPVEFKTVEVAPVESYVTFNVDGAKDAFSSWSLEVKDDNGMVQNFGPYTQERVSIPGKTILGTRPSGDYKVTMVGQAKNGSVVKKDASVHMVLWTPAENEEGQRYSVIYEIDQSKTINIYEKYLTDIVAPKIPKGGTVIIHGHTDIVGDEAHNLTLSIARANDVKDILEKALSRSGRTDVKFEWYGFGEDQNFAPFENNFPEERFYNRTVIIDILPNK